MLNTSQRLVNKNSLTWWYVFKTSWRRFSKTSRRRMGKMNILVLTQEVVLKMSFENEDERRLQGVFKTSSSRRMFSGMSEVFDIIESPYPLRNELRFKPQNILTVRYRIETCYFSWLQDMELCAQWTKGEYVSYQSVFAHRYCYIFFFICLSACLFCFFFSVWFYFVFCIRLSFSFNPVPTLPQFQVDLN